jgi:hypothetical protein
MTQEPQFHQTVSAQIQNAFRREFGSDVAKAPSEPRRCGHQRRKPVKVKLDAFIAELAKILDDSLLEYNPDFVTLWRPHRMHVILACLARCDIAGAEEFVGRKVRWRPSRRLRRNFAAKHHEFPDVLERIEAPIGTSTLADELSEVLQANAETVEDTADFVLRIFEIRLF